MKFWNFVKDDETGDVELRITGEIVSDDDIWLYEWFGIAAISPNAFRAELKELAGKNITVWIDSWGGDVFAGAGIYNALMEHKGSVTVKVDGKAVSAASIIAMAGTEVLMSPASIIMVHNPWTQQAGESGDMRKAADVLDEVKEAIVNAYEIKTGRTREDLSGLMDRESWMSAKTAIAEGFADGILYTEESGPVENAYNLSGLAIKNSANEAMKKFFEVFRQQEKADTPDNRVVNKKRVNVREKSFRRYEQYG